MSYVDFLGALHRSGKLQSMHPSTQAVLTTLAIICANGPKALSTKVIADLSGLGVVTTRKALRVLLASGLVHRRELPKVMPLDKLAGMYRIDKNYPSGLSSPSGQTTEHEDSQVVSAQVVLAGDPARRAGAARVCTVRLRRGKDGGR